MVKIDLEKICPKIWCQNEEKHNNLHRREQISTQWQIESNRPSGSQDIPIYRIDLQERLKYTRLGLEEVLTKSAKQWEKLSKINKHFITLIRKK